MAFITAPTGPPTSITTSGTRNTITVQWEEVACIDRNGDITGYSVRVMGENDMNVILREATISGLSPSTVYTVSVAAINSMGTGTYSDVIMVETLGGIFCSQHGVCHSLSVYNIAGTLSLSFNSSSITITISWILYNATATGYIISYSNTNIDCFNISYDNITTSDMLAQLTVLEEGTAYSITVTATLSENGGAVVETIIATTISVGEYITS